MFSYENGFIFCYCSYEIVSCLHWTQCNKLYIEKKRTLTLSYQFTYNTQFNESNENVLLEDKWAVPMIQDKYEG